MATIIFIVTSGILLALLGTRRANAVLARHPVTLNNAQTQLPELYVVVPLSVVGIAALVITHTNNALLWHLPLALDRFVMPLVWLLSGGAFAYIFAIGVTLAIRTGHPRKTTVVTVAILLGAMLVGVQIIYSLPIAARLKNRVSHDGFVLQSTASSCVAASAANIVRTFGGKASERGMAELAGTTLRGTSPAGLVRALRHSGVTATPRTLDAAALARLPNPAVLLVQVPGRGPDTHAVTFLPAPPDTPTSQITIVDPLTGKMTLPTDKFVAANGWLGHLFECTPDLRPKTNDQRPTTKK